MKEGPVFSESQCVYKNILLTSFPLPFSELNLVGLALDVVD